MDHRLVLPASTIPTKFHDGWLRTGDVASVYPNGYVMISDRAKDVIKSGGEWVSSVDLENTLMGHPDVARGRRHRRARRAVGRAADGVRRVAEPTRRSRPTELRTWLAERTAKFWVPERWSFITEVPKTSVGKFDKKVLRARHAADQLEVENAGLSAVLLRAGKCFRQWLGLARTQVGVDALALEQLLEGLGRLRDGVLGEETLYIGHDVRLGQCGDRTDHPHDGVVGESLDQFGPLPANAAPMP